jgi:tetrahydromethanopterin S-methyltransferase subunit G
MNSKEFIELKNAICNLSKIINNGFNKIESTLDKIESRLDSGLEKIESRFEKIESRLEKIESNTNQNKWGKSKYNRLKKVTCNINNCNGFIGFIDNKLFAGTANHLITISESSSIKIEINQELHKFLNENKIDFNNLSFENPQSPIPIISLHII